MTELAMLAQSDPTNPFFHGFEPIGRTLLVGVLAFAVLVVLQYVVTWSSVRWHPVRQLVTGSPPVGAFGRPISGASDASGARDG